MILFFLMVVTRLNVLDKVSTQPHTFIMHLSFNCINLFVNKYACIMNVLGCADILPHAVAKLL